MSNLEFSKTGKFLTIGFRGKVDSLNSDQIEKEIFDALSYTPSSNIEFDFDELEYISSAGLRVILKFKKLVKSIRIINCGKDIYEILEMTGFTSMMEVRKSLRVISIEGCEMIGQGFAGKVYRLDPDTIIKVFYRIDASLDDIERERRLAKQAFILGIPTAISFDVVKVKEGGYGMVFELLKSDSFQKLFIKHPEKFDEYQKQYNELLKTIITTEVPEGALPRRLDSAWEWYNLIEEKGCFSIENTAKIKHLIESIPDNKTMIHGDYHIKNIMMQGKEPLLIDMDTLGTGHPIFEFAAFYLTYIGYQRVDKQNIIEFLGISQDTATKLFYGAVDYIYSDRSVEERKQIIEKIELFGNIWMVYKVYSFEPDNLLRLNDSISVVNELIDKYDTLNF